MRIIGPATEADMVHAFRDAEPNRWASRGYPDRFIFTGFLSVIAGGTGSHSLRAIYTRTVAALMGGISADRLPFLLGTSASMGEWVFYKDQP